MPGNGYGKWMEHLFNSRHPISNIWQQIEDVVTGSRVLLQGEPVFFIHLAVRLKRSPLLISCHPVKFNDQKRVCEWAKRFRKALRSSSLLLIFDIMARKKKKKWIEKKENRCIQLFTWVFQQISFQQISLFHNVIIQSIKEIPCF